jgi:hypothetical protein
MAAKAPDPIDKYVGARVRMRRLMLGMSQDKLGEKLGITFQQVQKYEKGTNRVSAGRLQAMPIFYRSSRFHSSSKVLGKMGARTSLVIWVIALAVFALLIAAGFYSLFR